MDNILYKVNDDIIMILRIAKNIGWGQITINTIFRILYFVQTLYSFRYKNKKNIFDYYHFTVTLFGPYSDLINRSVAYLESATFIEKKTDGYTINSFPEKGMNQGKFIWIKTVMLMLGKYGENEVFSFVLNDPSYEEAYRTNDINGIISTSSSSKTIKVLTDFKKAFEENLSNFSTISDEQYIEMYFDFIFGQIIQK